MKRKYVEGLLKIVILQDYKVHQAIGQGNVVLRIYREVFS